MYWFVAFYIQERSILYVNDITGTYAGFIICEKIILVDITKIKRSWIKRRFFYAPVVGMSTELLN